jgi:hypothetical protein
MAIVNLYLKEDMLNPTFYYGSVVGYSTSYLSLSNGIKSGTYHGLFDYSSVDTLSRSTITGYEGYTNGQLSSSVSGLSLLLSSLDSYSQSGNALGLYQNALSGNDTINGSSFNDILLGFAGSDNINGGVGIDTAGYLSIRNNCSINKTLTGFTVSSSADGTDILTGIERLKFSDTKLAIDLDGNAGLTVKILGSVFGATFVSNKQFVGIGLQFLDGGMSYSDLMKLAIDTRLGAGASNTAVVNLLYTNVVGSAPGKADLDHFVGLLDSHTVTISGLGIMAADTALNTTNINIIGLAQTGIEFI